MRVLALVIVLAGLATPARARQAETPPPADPPQTGVEIDPTKLGVSLSRIQKGLRLSEIKDKETRDGLRLEFNVQVFGVAPRIDVIPDGEDLVFGPVPGTAPSHPQFLEFVTPQIFRTPAVPFSTFAVWAAKWVAEKSKKQRCEEEIANYRALIMQGVNVSAPRCTQ